ncbi:MAG: FAD-dependent oxidoreductase [Steroidobacteraceae bacterium]
MNPASAAVIGAGLAGIACARRLSAAGWQLRVFECQRAPGGRVATRRFEAAAFDHGAQYFNVREPSFRAVIEAASTAGAAERWRPRWPGGDQERGELWVGAPGMSALPRFLAQDLDVEYGARITRLERTDACWTLIDDRGAGHSDFGLVVLALPAPEAAILAAAHTPLADRVRAVPMAPCLAVMVAFAGTLGDVPDAGFTDDEILPWFARNGSKPGRDAPDAWVLHASADYSRREFDAPPARVQNTLLARLAGQLGRTLPGVLLSDIHRWRHARVEAPVGEAFLLDGESQIGFCGDWCLDARAEAAFLSGDALGAALLETRHSDSSGKMRDRR